MNTLTIYVRREILSDESSVYDVILPGGRELAARDFAAALALAGAVADAINAHTDERAEVRHA